MYRAIILAPHADDEIIGCFSVLEECSVILFGSVEALEEVKSKNLYPNKRLGLIATDLDDYYASGDIRMYIPDPYTELHPLHKQIGNLVLATVDSRYELVLYSTNMNTPYMQEIKNPEAKKALLNASYPEKQDLWKYDWKYFLFESYVHIRKDLLC